MADWNFRRGFAGSPPAGIPTLGTFGRGFETTYSFGTGKAIDTIVKRLDVATTGLDRSEDHMAIPPVLLNHGQEHDFGVFDPLKSARIGLELVGLQLKTLPGAVIQLGPYSVQSPGGGALYETLQSDRNIDPLQPTDPVGKVGELKVTNPFADVETAANVPDPTFASRRNNLSLGLMDINNDGTYHSIWNVKFDIRDSSLTGDILLSGELLLEASGLWSHTPFSDAAFRIPGINEDLADHPGPFGSPIDTSEDFWIRPATESGGLLKIMAGEDVFVGGWLPDRNGVEDPVLAVFTSFPLPAATHGIVDPVPEGGTTAFTFASGLTALWTFSKLRRTPSASRV